MDKCWQWWPSYNELDNDDGYDNDDNNGDYDISEDNMMMIKYFSNIDYYVQYIFRIDNTSQQYNHNTYL